MKHMSRKSLAALGLTVAGFFCFFAAPASAQIPVTDGAHIGINKLAWVEQYRQMYSDELNQLEQIRNQVQQLQNEARMLQEKRVTGMKLQSNIGPRETNLQTREETAYLKERCGSLAGGGGGPGIFGGGLQDLLGGGSGPARVAEARQRQHAACSELVVMENKRHNFVVDTIKTLLKQDQQITELREEAAEIPPDEEGRVQHNSNQMQNLLAEQTGNMEAAQRQLQYYEQQINALKDEMAWAGQAAFTNKRANVLGQAVQYGTLKAALGLARKRDR